jgi:hypothetical protein
MRMSELAEQMADDDATKPSRFLAVRCANA